MGPVDPGEVALAVFGMHALIDGEYPRIGIGKLREMQDYTDLVRKRAKVVTEPTDETPEYVPPKSYKQLLDRLTNPLTPETVQALVNRFPGNAHEVTGPFVQCAQRAWEYLRSIFPVQEYQTFAGPETLVPDDDAVWSFLTILWPIQDPLVCMDLIAIGGVLDIQVAAMRHVYPTLSTLFDSALYQATAEAKASKKSFHLPVIAEDGFSTWFGRDMSVADPSDPSLNSNEPNKAQPVSPGPNLATPNQKALQT